MISVVCVFNNRPMLERILLPSLKQQTANHEFIPVDNTDGRFVSAASALNYGGTRANGKYILFVHQDIELGSASWLADIERILDNTPSLGIAGAVGMSLKGWTWEEGGLGHMSDRGEIRNKPVEVPTETNTLDECVLIIPSAVFSHLKFDSFTFDNWHCYGCDYCLSVQERGLKAYVLPGFVYHCSLSTNSKDLLKYQIRLYRKHSRAFPKINTTTGSLTANRVIISLIIHGLSYVYKKLVWAKLRESWLDRARKELAGCESVLDLGCGYNSPLQQYKIPHKVGVEIFEPYLEESRKKAIHNEYINADLRTLSLPPKSYDAVFCSEVLEHMTKEDGFQLVRNMDSWARKVVIVTTPNGYIYQDGYDNNAFQAHTSGWTVSDLRGSGFKVRGMNSWKFLRGPKGVMKLRPILFWEMVAESTGLIANYLPSLSYQLLAIKRTDSCFSTQVF